LGYFSPTVAAAAAQNEVAEDREKVRPGKAALASIAAGGWISQRFTCRQAVDDHIKEAADGSPQYSKDDNIKYFHSY
jgi:hypothetical protein